MNQNRPPVIAIDGPAGAGKSTVARAVAGALGFVYIDTGAMYRAVTCLALERRIAPDDEPALRELLRDLDLRFTTDGKVFHGERDLGGSLRLPEVTAAVSRVAGQPAVREYLKRAQRRLGRDGGVVLDGRDIGTAVFPDAEFKFYLDASLESRALRRQADAKESHHGDLAVLMREIAQRDEQDRNRAFDPLVRAADALYIDSTGMTQDQVRDAMLATIRNASPPVTRPAAEGAEGALPLEPTEQYTDPEPGMSAEALETPNKLRTGDVVEGHIVLVDDSHVWVDVGYKSEGKIDKSEFDTPPAMDSKVTVVVVTMSDSQGDLIVSKRRAEAQVMRRSIENAVESGELVTGKIIAEAKGGMRVSFSGIEGYVPMSHIEIGKAGEPASYIGKTFEFKVLKCDRRGKNLSVVVSRRDILQSRREDAVRDVLGKVKVGDVVDGVVKNTAKMGVFVDIGGMDGLIQFSDLSWKKGVAAKDLVKPGDEIKVMVVAVDQERGRIGLSLKDLERDPFIDFAAAHNEGDVVDGKVVKLETYGAFVQVAEGVEGLLHVSELSWTKRINHPKDVLKPGQEVQVKLLGIDREGRKLSLGFRQLLNNPYDNIEDDYAVGSRHTGKISHLSEFGLFVELPSGIDGLVRKEDLSWERGDKDMEGKFTPGELVTVQILRVDKKTRKISLGIKQLQDNPVEIFKFNNPPGTKLPGKVTRLADFGAFVDIGGGVEGLVHISRLSDKRVEKVSDAVKVGDEVMVKILDVDSVTGKVSLSIKDLDKEEEKKIANQYKGDDRGTFRLGDMIDLSKIKDTTR